MTWDGGPGSGTGSLWQRGKCSVRLAKGLEEGELERVSIRAWTGRKLVVEVQGHEVAIDR